MRKIQFLAKSARKYAGHKIFGNVNPFLLIILPTNRCNLDCQYCPPTKTKQKMDITSKDFNQLIQICKNDKIPFISFSGGEPTLHPQFASMVKLAVRHVPLINLNTNGTTITPRNAGFYAKSLDYIRISLDGNEKVHDKLCRVPGTYKKVLKSLELLMSVPNKRARVGINIVVRRNSTSVANFCDSMKHKIDFISILPEFDLIKAKGRDTAYARKYAETAKSMGSISANTDSFLMDKFNKQDCLAGKTFFMASWDGNMYSCPFMTEVAPIAKIGTFSSCREIPYDNPVDNCNGCHATCAIETSKLFNMSWWQLCSHSISLARTHKLV